MTPASCALTFAAFIIAIPKSASMMMPIANNEKRLHNRAYYDMRFFALSNATKKRFTSIIPCALAIFNFKLDQNLLDITNYAR